MAQILIITGAAIYGLLGSLHLFYTLFSDKFDPHDLAVKEAMKATSPRLTRDMTLWNAWIGYNASHSMGAIMVAAFYIPLTLWNFPFLEQSLWFSLFPVVIGCISLVLAKRYWFNIPFYGILISTLCFIGAAAIINLPRL